MILPRCKTVTLPYAQTALQSTIRYDDNSTTIPLRCCLMLVCLMLVVSLLLASLIDIIYRGHRHSDGYDRPGQIAALLHLVSSSISPSCE
ncbi:hypothetical protein BJY00DRAFT_275442 [Aspergillus carlsbadensis]|nr:hypothetical protein BJY00DRAFT_275442 [Aspergillus carlsbadensis]